MFSKWELGVSEHIVKSLIREFIKRHVPELSNIIHILPELPLEKLSEESFLKIPNTCLCIQVSRENEKPVKYLAIKPSGKKPEEIPDWKKYEKPLNVLHNIIIRYYEYMRRKNLFLHKTELVKKNAVIILLNNKKETGIILEPLLI